MKCVSARIFEYPTNLTLPLPQEMRDWCAARDCNPKGSYDLVVGEQVMFNITAIHSDRTSVLPCPNTLVSLQEC